jgi:hypothetical protein
VVGSLCGKSFNNSKSIREKFSPLRKPRRKPFSFLIPDPPLKNPVGFFHGPVFAYRLISASGARLSISLLN